VGDQRRLSAALDRPSLAAIAASTHFVVSTGELYGRGVTRDQIRHLVTIGFLHRLHRGVYAVGRRAVPFAGRCRAAWLACGPGSAVSHVSAAVDWGIRPSGGRLHVSAPRGRGQHPDLHVHRPRSLPPEDIVDRDGYAVTSVARTVLDMSPGQSVDTVGRWIHEAGVQRVLDVREVWALLARLPRHRGARVVEAALTYEVAPTRSGLEEHFLGIVRRAGLPPPQVNDHVWSGVALEEVDFHFPELGLIIEVDGARYHASRWRRRRDAQKDARFRALGKVVRRFHELEITLRPGDVAAETLRLAAVGLGHAARTRISQPTP
jgi:hypothetical protein